MIKTVSAFNPNDVVKDIKRTMKTVSVGIAFKPNDVLRDIDRDMFVGTGLEYSGGGYCFITGEKDITFFGEVDKVDMVEVRRILRNVRRWKGVTGAGVSVYEDETDDEE